MRSYFFPFYTDIMHLYKFYNHYEAAMLIEEIVNDALFDVVINSDS